MKLGLALPSFVEDPDIPIGVARKADDAGVDGVFVYDHLWRDRPPPRRPALEGLTLLGAVAAETTRTAVGTLVARATLRPPAVLATALETAHRISNGRVIAAIGAGDSESRAENEAFGLGFGTMVDRVSALHDAVVATRRHDYPVWVGGRAAAVREIVAVADGWNRWGGDPAAFAEQSELVRAVAPDATLTWGGLVALGTDDDAAQEKAAARNASAGVIVGGPRTVAARLREFADVGASWAILGPLDASNPENAVLIARVKEELAP